jgi:uncharacterized coiled-coil DUF342 family protein
VIAGRKHETGDNPAKFILVTDIWQSSRLMEDLPQEYGAALAVHNRIVEQGVAANRGQIYKNIGGEIESTKAEIEYLDMQRQTRPMDLKKEGEMIDEIRSKRKNLEQLEKILPEQDDLSSEVMTIDEKIDQLFKKADSEQQKLVALSNESQGIFDDIKKKSAEISHLITQANQKHDEYMEIMERSGHFHERAMEMRGKVVALKREQQSKVRAARQEIKKQNVKVKKALEDKKRLDAAADEAVKALRKKGKIEM